MIHQKLNPYFSILFLTLIASGATYVLVRQSNNMESEESLPVAVRHQISNTTANRIDTSDWKTYRKYGFDVKYPGDWHVNFEGPDLEIASVSKTEYIHGLGYPRFGAAWLTVHLIPCKNYCSGGEEVVDVGAAKPVVSITKTKDYDVIGIEGSVTYVLTFSFWKDDENERAYRQTFDTILSALTFY